MRRLGVFLAVSATVVMVDPTLAAAAREREPFQIERGAGHDTQSLASPDYEGYRPAWANPYAEPPDVGINDDPTPFFPSDVDSGPSPLDPDAF